MAEENKNEFIHELAPFDKLVIENLALAEKNAELESELNKYKLSERRTTVRNHLVKRFKIDMEANDFTVDTRTGTVKVKPKNAT